MADRNPSDADWCHVFIEDEEDTPQRYPLRRLLEAVAEAVEPTPKRWLVSGVWGQGYKTARLEDSIGPTPEDDALIDTATLIDLDDDPDEWFYDVVIRLPDRSLTFGIFDSGRLFLDGRCALVRRIARPFERVTEVDADLVAPVTRSQRP